MNFGVFLTKKTVGNRGVCTIDVAAWRSSTVDKISK